MPLEEINLVKMQKLVGASFELRLMLETRNNEGRSG
jgi:hypothetical protein